MNKIKKLIAAICILALIFSLTGCGYSVSGNIKMTSASRADCTATIGFDRELMDALAEICETDIKGFIKQMKADGAKYSKKKIDGTVYYLFTMTQKKQTFKQVEEFLEGVGLTDVVFTKDFFSGTLDLSEYSEDTGEGSLMNQIRTYAAQDPEQELHFIFKMSITYKAKVVLTNGKLSKTKKKVSWSIKDSSKKRILYASTIAGKKTAYVTNIKNNKTYRAGKMIKIKNAKNAARITLDNKKIKNNKKVTAKGTHVLTIWSRNGKIKKTTFKIK